MNEIAPPSEHFSWKEVTFSSTAERYNINNSVPEVIGIACINTAKQMERIRALLGFPIHVDSWYRCPQLNTLVRGVPNSQHTKGEAVDFLCDPYGTPLQICRRIIQFPELIKFDQLILEHSWVHISFNSDPNATQRHQVLSLLNTGHYASGLTDANGVAYA